MHQSIEHRRRAALLSDAVGDNKRYGGAYVDKWIDGWVMREEPMMLTAAELNVERNPSHDFPEPRRVYAWIRYPSRAVQVKAHAVAWTRTAVKLQFIEPQSSDTEGRLGVDGCGDARIKRTLVDKRG